MIPVTNKIFFFLYGFLLLLFFSQCHNFYRAVVLKKSTAAQLSGSIDSLSSHNRYFILRNGSDAFYMKNPLLSADQTTLTCSLEELSSFNQFHLRKGGKGKMQYKKTDQNEISVLNEVHFYIAPDSKAALGEYTFPLDRVQKLK